MRVGLALEAKYLEFLLVFSSIEKPQELLSLHQNEFFKWEKEGEADLFRIHLVALVYIQDLTNLLAYQCALQ